MEECVFFNIANNKIPCIKVYEDDDFLAFLDIHPINRGHTLVIPKKHYKDLFEIDEDILKKYLLVIKKVAFATKKALNADGINIGMNNGETAGQVVMHAHIHIIPRFTSDGLANWDRKVEIKQEELEEIAEKIRKEI